MIMNIDIFTNIISEGDEKYVDLSTATLSTTSSNDGCITAINCDSPRLKIGKQLYSDLQNAERIEVLFTDEHVILIPARNENSGIKLGKGNILYNAAIVRKIQKLAGIEETPGSTKIGSYHMQKFDENTVAAVISFN